MKLDKRRCIITVIIILLVAFLMFASFFGIKLKANENGEKKDIIPEYKLGMEFGEKRVIIAEVDKTVTESIYDSEDNLVVEPEEGVEYTEEAGYRTETVKTNEDEVLTEENYKKAKNIIDKKLKQSGATQYFTDLDKKTGTIRIEIPEDQDSDEIENIIERSGMFLLLDDSTYETVFDNESNYIKKASVVMNQSEVGTGIFLQLEFNSEGLKKLEELSNAYTTETKTETESETEIEEVETEEVVVEENNETEETEETATETEEQEEEKTPKTYYVLVNGSIIGRTEIKNVMYDNKMYLSYGQSTDNAELQDLIKVVRREAVLLNNSSLPIVYNFSLETDKTDEEVIEDETIEEPEITEQDEQVVDESLETANTETEEKTDDKEIQQRINIVYIASIGGVFVIAYIYLVIKFKAKGFISIYFQVGFLAVLLLLLRLTSVILTTEAMAGIVVSMVLEYLYTFIVLSNIESGEVEVYKKSVLCFFLNSLPIYVISVVFSFAQRAHISGFGMSLFWGIIIIYVYNFIFSKYVYESLSRRS